MSQGLRAKRYTGAERALQMPTRLMLYKRTRSKRGTAPPGPRACPGPRPGTGKAARRTAGSRSPRRTG
eukprot:1372409-Pyramimonas_sp.AAC.1